MGAKYKKIVSVTKKVHKTLKTKRVKNTTNLIEKKPHAVVRHAIKVISKSKEAILKKQVAVVKARKVITNIAIKITHHVTVIHHLMSHKVVTKHHKQLIAKHKKLLKVQKQVMAKKKKVFHKAKVALTKHKKIVHKKVKVLKKTKNVKVQHKSTAKSTVSEVKKIIKQKVPTSIAFAASIESKAELVLHPAIAVKKAAQVIVEQKKVVIEIKKLETKKVLSKVEKAKLVTFKKKF